MPLTHFPSSSSKTHHAQSHQVNGPVDIFLDQKKMIAVGESDPHRLLATPLAMVSNCPAAMCSSVESLSSCHYDAGGYLSSCEPIYEEIKTLPAARLSGMGHAEKSRNNGVYHQYACLSETVTSAAAQRANGNQSSLFSLIKYNASRAELGDQIQTVEPEENRRLNACAENPLRPDGQVTGERIYENIVLEGQVTHHPFSPGDYYQETKQLGQKGKSYNPHTGLFSDEDVKQKSGIGCFRGLADLIARAMTRDRRQTTSL